MKDEHARGKPSLVQHLLLAGYILFFTGLIFSLRAVSSSSTGLLIAGGLLYNRQQEGRLLNYQVKNLFLFSCIVYFSYLLLSQSIYNTLPDGWRQIQLKTGLVLTPLAVCCSSLFVAANKKKLLIFYTLLLTGACIFCLLAAFRQYYNTGDSSHFFYHSLVYPFKQHAVYFSLLVFFSLISLIHTTKRKDRLFPEPVRLSLIIFLTIYLVLLSSRLVISFWGLYLLYFIFISSRLLHRNKWVTVFFVFALVTGGLLLITTRNPVGRRFNEIIQGDLSLLKKDNYHTGEYFNGLQFRLLQWKLVPEILKEKESWWTGVGAGNAQPFLAEKYISKNMYGGKPGTSDSGYLLLNTHNQLLELVLKNGIPAGLLFLFICFTLVRLAWQKKKEALSFTIILLLLYCGIEAVLETQYGIVIFTFFPLFYAQE